MTESRPIDVLGTVWHTDRHERTSLGCLVEAAKDRDDSTARARIVDEVHAWVADGRLKVDPDAIVIGIPSRPDRPNLLVSAVARAVATATGSVSVDAVVRHRVTGRLRDLDPTERPATVLAANYEVVEAVGGRHVVLVRAAQPLAALGHHVVHHDRGAWRGDGDGGRRRRCGQLGG